MVRLVIAGDVAVSRPDPTSIFAEVADELRAADLTLVNQEWPLRDRGEPWPGKTGKIISSPPESIEALTFAGVDVVGLANNHMLNYGYDGMFQTLEILDEAGIAHAGAGRNLESAHTPAILERSGTRIAVLSYTSVYPRGWESTPDRAGLATVRIDSSYTPYRRVDEMPGSPYDVVTTPDPSDVEQLEEDIRAARAQADLVVLMWHWGVSMGYQHLVGYQTELGHRAIEAGASLVIGHHPHTLQPVEVYKGGVICYSIAQFGFDLESTSNSQETLLVECDLDDRSLSQVFLRPALSLPDGGIRFVTGADAAPVVEWIKRLCRPFGTVLTPEGDRLRVGLSPSGGQ